MAIIKAVFDMIVDEFTLGIADRGFNGMELLGQLNTRPLLLDHCDDGSEMAFSPLKALDDGWMTVMFHLNIL